MRRFNITVNGRQYEVDVEELNGARPAASAPIAAAAPAPMAAAPVPAAAPATPTPAAAAPAPAPAPVASANIPEGGTKINAPMPGTILDIKVNVGDTVKAGQVLLILEAMKMENEIMSPVAGKIAAVPTSKGSSVNSGEILVVIE